MAAAFGVVERVALCAWRAAAARVDGAPGLEELGAVVGPSDALSSSPFDLMFETAWKHLARKRRNASG